MSNKTHAPSQPIKTERGIHCLGTKIVETVVMPGVHVPDLLYYFSLTEDGFPKNRPDSTIVLRAGVVEKQNSGDWVVEFTFSKEFSLAFYESLQRFSMNKKLQYHGLTRREIVEKDLIIGHFRRLQDELRINNEWNDRYLPLREKP